MVASVFYKEEIAYVVVGKSVVGGACTCMHLYCFMSLTSFQMDTEKNIILNFGWLVKKKKSVNMLFYSQSLLKLAGKDSLILEFGFGGE